MYRSYRAWLTLGLALLDTLLINVAFFIAYHARYEWQLIRPVGEANYVPLREYIPVSLVLTAILLAVYKMEGLYTPKRGTSWLDEVYAIFIGTLAGIGGMIVITFFYRPYFYSRLLFGYAGISVTLTLSLSHLMVRQVWGYLRGRGIGVDRVLVVGAGEIGRAIMRSIMALPQLGYRVVGFIDDEVPEKTIGRFPSLGSTKDLPRLLLERRVDEVIITLPWTSHEEIIKMVAQCERARVRARIVPDLFQMSLSRVDVEEVGGIPLLGVKEVSIRGWNLALKRAIDVVVSATTLVLLSPLILLIATLTKLESPGPPLFRQTRIGRNGRPFTLYKFRSMRPEAEEELSEVGDLDEAEGVFFKIREDPRRTRVGRVLRRLSLDELPQMYNILRGEMSLVGPRPALPSEVERYEEWHRRRLGVLPGLTGLWQVMGRSDLAFDEMVMLDLFYIENWSLWLDLKIMLITIPTILSGKGAY